MFRIVKPNKQKPFTIGRKEGSDLHFPERFVSREHAIIECKETASGCEWHIRSLTTNSFTLLNDVQVTESEIHDGDIIGIGVKQMRANLKDGELSLLLFDANDEVERIELEDTPTTREIDDEGSKNEIQFRAYENGAEIQFRHAVTDEKGKRYKKIVLGENETTRYDQTEITAKDGALLLRKASVGFDIHVRNLDVFTGKKQLLSGIDFDLPAGEILAIIGRSGQGKSSLLKLFEGIYRKGEQSEVHIGGVDYRCKKIREHIAILAQDPPLRGDLTVDETLRHGARIAMDSHDFRKNAEGRLEKFCELFGLSDRRKNRIKTLSGGEHRRVALAAELMGNPGLIILDEPLSGLDPFNSRILCSHLKQLAFLGHTIILTTHSYEALHIANKVLVLHRGEQGFYGTPQAAYQYFKTNDPETILSNLGHDASSAWKESGIASRDTVKDNCNHIYFTSRKNSESLLYGMKLTLKQWLRDKGKTAALLLQPFIIGFLFSQIFSATSSLWTVSFAIILCANWFALSLSIREIVQEKDIVRGELRKGQKVIPYYFGKFLLPTVAAFLQTAIVYAFVAYRVPVPPSIALLAATFACTVAPAVAMGLLVSSLSKNSGQANAFLPLLIIPQVALAGALVPFDQMQHIGKWLSTIVWSRYNQNSLLNIFLERPDNIRNPISALSLALIFCIITAIILHSSKKAK
ncbi:ATP-binding cassette domain-containing protein [Fibrobacter succinogenes]|uniref:ATP-binding cassette domain-containing protein n=1 Tax=Fibrobacter succinogenes TaxID=833 RepID=UPI001563F4FC|nr:ATP-binding cassette domain-containing protein [Fibrobacter succinogenes]